tara:strand:+ start:466 stop:705 length:240 start_codon:yes stop_codon:yes gene_type:complete
MLCEYSELIGKVGEGIHSYRLFNIAILDVIITMIGAYFLQKKFFSNYSYLQVLIVVFIMGIISHRIFCVRTTIDKMLFK